MTVGTIAVTQGSGKNIATYEFTDSDSTVKEIQRVAFSDDTGAEKLVLANPGFVTLEPNTTGGWLPFTNTNTPLTNTKVQVKSTVDASS